MYIQNCTVEKTYILTFMEMYSRIKLGLNEILAGQKKM
jgi:hypothetical protein